MVPQNGATTYARTTQDGRLPTLPNLEKTLVVELIFWPLPV